MELSLLFSEALTPLVLAMQKQFNFSHVLAGATASGKVGITWIQTGKKTKSVYLKCTVTFVLRNPDIQCILPTTLRRHKTGCCREVAVVERLII